MPSGARINLAAPTLGGKQLWADVFWYAGWRIQEPVHADHHRLLDPSNRRRAWGTLEACREAFESFREAEGARVESRHAVVLLHGLGRTRSSLAKLARAARDAGYAPADIEYPSTRRSIDEHVDRLTALLDALEDVDRVSFVTHSLGGLVTRVALSRESAWRRRIELGRVVMIAPPSTGAVIAEQLSRYRAFRALLGPPAMGIASGEPLSIPPPPCPFGVIAGGGPGGKGWNPWMTGDDDGVVRVEETRLEGADDFLLVRGFHTFIMDHPGVVESAIRFLRVGRFAE